MRYNIYHNLLIKASINEVFDAVSQPQHLDNWWTLKSSGIPELGAEYNLNFTDEYDWYCKVSKIELNKSINWPEANHHFKHSSFCWAMLLNGLKNYLEKGIVISFENRS